MKSQKGFTLIELLVTTLIVGTLSSIALSSYRDYILKVEASEGVRVLTQTSISLEQYFQDNRTYEKACDSQAVKKHFSNLNYFDVTCNDMEMDSYTVTATSKSGFTYTLTETNSKSTTTVPEGWNTNEECWVISKEGACK